MKPLGDELDDDFANSQIPQKFQLEEDFDTPDMTILPTGMQRPNSLIQEVFEGCEAAKARTKYKVLASLMEEVGELATEVNISEGFLPTSKKGGDGIVGESVDVILCALDMIYMDWSSNHLTDLNDLEELIHTIVKAKVAKWKLKAKQQS